MRHKKYSEKAGCSAGKGGEAKNSKQILPFIDHRPREDLEWQQIYADVTKSALIDGIKNTPRV